MGDLRQDTSQRNHRHSVLLTSSELGFVAHLETVFGVAGTNKVLARCLADHLGATLEPVVAQVPERGGLPARELLPSDAKPYTLRLTQGENAAVSDLRRAWGGSVSAVVRRVLKLAFEANLSPPPANLPGPLPTRRVALSKLFPKAVSKVPKENP